MWTCLLLLCAQFAASMSSDPVVEEKCPTNCNCTGGKSVLIVDCHGRTDIDREQLSHELDSLLSSNLTYGRLTRLDIRNSPLTHVRRYVCRLTSLTQLRLGYNRLTQLPDCFTNLSNLVEFWAPGNTIETLQDGVFDGLTKLQTLVLSRNRISYVGLSICRLTSLTQLWLGYNRLTRLPDCFTNLSNLVEFSAVNNSTETLQDGVFDGLTKLQLLYLGGNRISSIDLSICRLMSLTQLYLDNNRLTRLPDNCLTNLLHLTLFNAANNAIESLQNDVFDGLKKLQYLLLDGNNISSIDLCVCGLRALTQLSVTNSRLTRVPDNCLTNLLNLTVFSAANNAIESLQDGVFDGLTKLERLYLARNRISSISISVFATSSRLSSLMWIDLSKNNLTSLEPWVYDLGLVGRLHRRVWIDLKDNKISEFTNKMGRNNVCENESPFAVVQLKNNNIKHWIDIINGWQADVTKLFDCYRLDIDALGVVLLIDDNNVACDCVEYHFYKTAAMQRLRRASDWSKLTCRLTDPMTRRSSVVKAFDVDPSLFVCELTERCPAECACFHRPANSTLHVYCSNTNVTVLPLELPELPDNRTKYKLDFFNNGFLHRLERRDYSIDTSILDVSNCGIDDIFDWEEILKMPVINLFGNKISSLPRSILPVNITTEKLNLANNPWNCSCGNKWMSNWFHSIVDQLTDTVRCDSPSRLRGRNIVEISEDEFCVDPPSNRVLTITLSSVAGILVVLLSVGFIVFRLRVKLFTRWKFHPFDRDECLGEDMDYDVFLCCSSEDHRPHAVGILELLESKGYRVCYHERDFLPGERILDNICNSIERSKRTVCLLSGNFLRSTFCMFEFEAAFQRNIVEKRKKRLIVLMMLDSPAELLADDAEDMATLRQYLRQYTYIDYTADDWLDRLLYALPLRGLLQRNEDPDDDVQPRNEDFDDDVRLVQF